MYTTIDAKYCDSDNVAGLRSQCRVCARDSNRNDLARVLNFFIYYYIYSRPKIAVTDDCVSRRSSSRIIFSSIILVALFSDHKKSIRDTVRCFRERRYRSHKCVVIIEVNVDTRKLRYINDTVIVTDIYTRKHF